MLVSVRTVGVCDNDSLLVPSTSFIRLSWKRRWNVAMEETHEDFAMKTHIKRGELASTINGIVIKL